MKKLIEQIIKFGIVGAICFVLDFAIYTVMTNVLNIHYLISGFTSFTVSVVTNYILSMRYVFVAREDMSKTKQFIIYVILSAIGLGLNELILYTCISIIYANTTFLMRLFSGKFIKILAKIVSTGIVTIYNFVTRKLFLEKH